MKKQDKSKFPQKMIEESLERVIKNMPANEWFWTVPWALGVDKNGNSMINENHTVDKEPAGTVQLGIKRIGLKYKVDITRCGYFNWNIRGDIANPNVIELIA